MGEESRGLGGGEKVRDVDEARHAALLGDASNCLCPRLMHILEGKVSGVRWAFSLV